MGKNGRGNQPQQPVVKLNAELPTDAAVTTDAPVINNDAAGETDATDTVNDAPAVIAPTNTGLILAIDPTVTSMELNDVVTTDASEMMNFLKSYIRCAVLRQFNVAEVNRIEVVSGKLLMNSNRTRMKLPKLNLRADGGFAETLPEYYKRALPAIKVWLIQSTQNAAITQEIVESFA